MSYLVIPIAPGVPDQRLSVQIDELTFTLDLLWNSRVEKWSMSMSDGDGAIFSGHALSLDYPVLQAYNDRRSPPGELLLVDTSDQQLEPGLDDLGERVLLLYVEQGSLP